MAYSTFQTGFVAVSIIYPATSSTFKRLSAEKKADIPMIFVSLHKISCVREFESKLLLRPVGIIHAQYAN